MEFLLFIAVIWFVIWAIGKSGGSSGSGSTPSSRGTYSPSNRSSGTRRQRSKSPDAYRPESRSSRSSNIAFRDSIAPTGTTSAVPSDLSGLHDAFTGAPLDKSLGLYQCKTCQVFYHQESVQVLREANNSACVSCQSNTIVSVVPGAAPSGGRDFAPEVVTLSNYSNYVGSVVTFEGYVHRVNESRRGNDFAVMFEDKSWARGFKLVFFRGAVQKVGGNRYIKSLRGKTVRVRGLLIQHERFGSEIIISEKSMILSVK